VKRFLCAALAAFALAAAPVAQVDPVFEAVIEGLYDKAAMPLRLPVKLPDLGQGTDRVYAIVEHAGSASYSVLLAFTPDCSGASVCRIGSFSGSRAGQKKLHGKAVRLQKGITGRYTESECGANCSDSVVSWREGPYLYSVGVKAGSQADAVALANSTLIK
jgi:hypothetical protein